MVKTQNLYADNCTGFYRELFILLLHLGCLKLLREEAVWPQNVIMNASPVDFHIAIDPTQPHI